MARKAVEGVILKEARRFVNRRFFSLFFSEQKFQTFNSRFRDFCSGRRISGPINFSHDENVSSMPETVNENRQELPPQTISDNLFQNTTHSDTSKSESKVGQTTNKVFGSTVIDRSTGEWLTLNQKLNSYPTVRRFTAIGMGGDDFVQSMVLAVESVIQHSVPKDYVKQRVSSRGKYVSVNIGPVRVVSSQQVRDVYNAMRSDDRMKFFL